MAMRAIMKKVSPKIRLMEGTRFPRCFSSSTVPEAVVCDTLETLMKDNGGKVKQITYEQWCDNKSGEINEIDRRWDEWVESCHERWQKKNAEEQLAELNTRWAYLRDLLHRHGFDTSNHRLQVSMRRTFTTGSPDRGLVSINKLDFGSCLSRHSVKGLLCITRNDAFIMYNPITGERSPSIEIDERRRTHGRIELGFDPLTDEHKVIWISKNTDPDPAVEIFTVGKNTWRRIDAVPPMAGIPPIDCLPPLYVDGCLYWRFRKLLRFTTEKIVRFDIVTEKFRVIPIPDFVVYRQHLQSVDLMELDGRVAVLDWRHAMEFSLWIMHEDANGNIKWTEENIHMPTDMPYGWHGDDDISIEALTGTDLIFMRLISSDSVYYYNRTTKESIRFPSAPDWDDWQRIIQV